MCMFVSVRAAAVQIVEQPVYKYHVQILNFRTEHSKRTCQINLLCLFVFILLVVEIWKYVDGRLFLGSILQTKIIN